MKTVSAGRYKGNYIHYGIREHMMGAVMNGIALQRVYYIWWNFLVFSDYMRASIRLSALMKTKLFMY